MLDLEQIDAEEINHNERSSEQETEVDDIGDYLPQPPDGGWGWVVMVASFSNFFIIDGVAYCFGVFLNDYVEFFKSSVGTTSLGNSLFCGVSLLVGPIVGALINKYGCRVVGITGSLILAASFILSIFSPNIEMMIVTYGLIGGFAMGMVQMPSVIGVGHYFDKRRAIATGVAVCGGGVGTFCIAPLSKVLLQEYGWRGAHLIIAGLFLQICIFSSSIRPLTVQRQPKSRSEKLEENGNLLTESRSAPSLNRANQRPHGGGHDYIKSGNRLVSKHDLISPMARKDIFLGGSVYDLAAEYKSHHSLDAKSHIVSLTHVPDHSKKRKSCLSCLPPAMADIIAEMMDISVLKNKAMAVMCLANIFAMFAYTVPFMFITPRAITFGISPTEAAFLVSVMGISSMIGRVIFGSISIKVSALLVNNLSITLAGVAVTLIPLSKSYVTMMIAAAAYGFFSSTYMSLASVITCDLVGLEKLTNGFGLLCMVRGITLIAGPPITGKLYDMTESYDTTFYVGGACLLVSAALHFLLHHPCLQGQEKEKNVIITNRNITEPAVG